MVKINGQDFPQPPFNSGTVLVLDEGGEGKIIRFHNAEEAMEISEAARSVAENWNANAE